MDRMTMNIMLTTYEEGNPNDQGVFSNGLKIAGQNKILLTGQWDDNGNPCRAIIADRVLDVRQMLIAVKGAVNPGPAHGPVALPRSVFPKSQIETRVPTRTRDIVEKIDEEKDWQARRQQMADALLPNNQWIHIQSTTHAPSAVRIGIPATGRLVPRQLAPEIHWYIVVASDLIAALDNISRKS